MYPEAIDRIEKAFENHERIPRLLAAQGYAYAAAGRRPEAEEILAELESAAEESYLDPILFAIVYVGLGEIDKTFEMLDRAYEERSPWLPTMSIDPKCDPLRDDPRFAELLRRIGLEPPRPGGQEQAA
jgi:tetratricopeptide (TPR) repeat protein